MTKSTPTAQGRPGTQYLDPKKVREVRQRIKNEGGHWDALSIVKAFGLVDGSESRFKKYFSGARAISDADLKNLCGIWKVSIAELLPDIYVVDRHITVFISVSGGEAPLSEARALAGFLSNLKFEVWEFFENKIPQKTISQLISETKKI